MRKKKVENLRIIIWFICASDIVCEAIWLSVPKHGTKCVSEQINNNVVVLADYYVISDDHTPVDATVSIQVSTYSPNFLFSKLVNFCPLLPSYSIYSKC